MDKQLIKAVHRRDPARLAVAAHESGHAVGELATGGQVNYVRINTGLLGGLHGGVCDWPLIEPGWAKDRKVGRLVALIAGHVAETRFCRLYLGMTERAALKHGREDCEGDYYTFKTTRSHHRLWSASLTWAWARAEDLLDANAGRLDELTRRLDRAGHLNGSAL